MQEIGLQFLFGKKICILLIYCQLLVIRPQRRTGYFFCKGGSSTYLVKICAFKMYKWTLFWEGTYSMSKSSQRMQWQKTQPSVKILWKLKSTQVVGNWESYKGWTNFQATAFSNKKLHILCVRYIKWYIASMSFCMKDGWWCKWKMGWLKGDSIVLYHETCAPGKVMPKSFRRLKSCRFDNYTFSSRWQQAWQSIGKKILQFVKNHAHTLTELGSRAVKICVCELSANNCTPEMLLRTRIKKTFHIFYDVVPFCFKHQHSYDSTTKILYEE